MPRFVILWEANASEWPTDPKQVKAVWEKVFAAADHLLKTGHLQEAGWYNNTRGYALQEADSKDKVLQLQAPFFPYFSHEIYEIVPWEKGKKAILTGLSKATSK